MALPSSDYDDSTSPGQVPNVVVHSVTGSPILPASDFVDSDRLDAANQLKKVKQTTQGTGAQDPEFWSNLWRSAKNSVSDQGMAIKQIAARYAQATGGAGSDLDTSMQGSGGIVPGQAPAATAAQSGQNLQALQAQQQQVQTQRAAGPQPSGFSGNAGALIGSVAPAAAESLAIPGSGIAGAAIQGAVGGALTPTSTSSPSMRGNVGVGAAAGGTLGALGKGLASVGFTNMLSDRANALVDYLDAKGVPMDLAQRTGSRFAGTLKNMVQDNPFTHKLDQDQQASFVENIMQRMGGNEELATPEALGRESTRILNEKNTVMQSYGPVRVDPQFLQDLASVNTRDITNPGTATMIDNKINDVFDAATKNIGTGGNAELNATQLNNTKMDLDNWILGKDPLLKDAGSKIQSALDNLVDRNAPPGIRPQIQELNRQTRVLMMAAKAADAEGNITPSKFWSASNPNGKNWRTAKTDLTGDQDTSELARAGQAVLSKNTPNSGTVPRYMSQQVGQNLAGAALGGYAGYESGGKHGMEAGALGAGLGGALGSFAAGKAAQAVIEPNMARFLAKAATVGAGTRATMQKVGSKLGGAVGTSFGPFVSQGLNLPSPTAEQTAGQPDDDNGT